MKNLSKFQETIITQQETNYIICTIKNIRQINTTIPQQINFIGKLEEDDGTTVFFIDEKQQKNILHFSLDLLNVGKSLK